MGPFPTTEYLILPCRDLLNNDYWNKLLGMNTHPLEASMATTKKTEKPRKKVISNQLTYLDVRQAARDGQQAFETFVITGKLPVSK
jgi:hypothetical protein